MNTQIMAGAFLLFLTLRHPNSPLILFLEINKYVEFQFFPTLGDSMLCGKDSGNLDLGLFLFTHHHERDPFHFLSRWTDQFSHRSDSSTTIGSTACSLYQKVFRCCTEFPDGVHSVCSKLHTDYMADFVIPLLKKCSLSQTISTQLCFCIVS